MEISVIVGSRVSEWQEIFLMFLCCPRLRKLHCSFSLPFHISLPAFAWWMLVLPVIHLFNKHHVNYCLMQGGDSCHQNRAPPSNVYAGEQADNILTRKHIFYCQLLATAMKRQKMQENRERFRNHLDSIVKKAFWSR